MNNFDKLTELLREYDYLITEDTCITDGKEYKMVTIDSDGIRAAFCEKGYGGYAKLDGKIAIENEVCFDKWSKAPVSLPIPTNDEERETVLEQLEYWATDEAYEISNAYDYDVITEYSQLM